MYKDTDYDALERNVKYIPWKGKKEEWYTWHKTFLVRAMTRDYHGILVGLESVPSDEEAKTIVGLTEMTSKQKKINNYKLNIRAYADLLQCCTQDIISFGIVDAAKDKELSNGNAKLAWKRLSDKFAGRNNAEKMKLIKQLNESRMKKRKILTNGLQIWNVLDNILQSVGKQLMTTNLSCTSFITYLQNTTLSTIST